MNHDFYMQRCIEIAGNGFPAVAPNPAVGCVVVHDNQIIGEGYHCHYGGAHAEVNALNNTIKKELLAESTLYVSLEPCSHFGKTPPCTERIISSKIPEVIIAMADPNPLVAGKGILALEKAGIQVRTGFMEKEAKWLNRRFITFHLKKRPYIILKWAETKDGFIAGNSGQTRQISNNYSHILSHRYRSEEMAIMAGFRTIQTDNPCLTTRYFPGKNPVRVIFDKDLQIPLTMNVFQQPGNVMVFNYLSNNHTGNATFIQIEKNKDALPQMMASLYQSGIQSLIVEGGSALLNEFIKEGLWDEARVFMSPLTFGVGLAAPVINGNILQKTMIDEDELSIFINPH